jgi:nitrite reductase/ring-hydroxylating ferredoxin subunit
MTELVDKLESAAALDSYGKKVGKTVRDNVPRGPVKDTLSGTWLGHALHPLLTDVVIGSFLSASLLDWLGGDGDGSAANRLTSVGIAAYGPTALTGVNDWADTEIADDAVRRVGLIHAATNSTALAIYTGALVQRRRGNRGKARLLSAAGGAVLGFGGYLGGHLSFAKGVGPNQTIFDEGPGDWTDVAAADELEAEKLTSVTAGDTPVVLYKHRDHVHAMHDRCSHRGCPLSELGEVDGEVIECTCHGSRFSLKDGSIERGPATTAQPVYDVRETGGRVEIKLKDS